MAATESNWTFSVEINKPPEIDIDDEYNNQTPVPGETITVQFFYKGGVGTGRASEFKIFVYDRSDTTTDTVPAGTADSPSASTDAKPIPVPFNVYPALPLVGSPELSPALIRAAVAGLISTNNIYAVFISGVWNRFHKGTFQVTAPADGYDENDDLITFSGQAQIR